MINYKLISTGMLPTNTYVLYSDSTKNCVVVDPAFDGGKVVDFLVQNKLNLCGILLTHGHFDHCGGVNTLLRLKNVAVYGSSEDAQLASQASKNQWRARAEDCTITDFVEDLPSFKIEEFTFNVLQTPGHTDGSLCYFVDDIMLSGDTLFCGAVGRTDLFGGSSQKMQKSLAIINKITEDYTVLPGHMDITSLTEEKKTNPYLRFEAYDYD